MTKNNIAYTPEQLRKTEEFVQLLKNGSSESNHEIIVTLGCAFISGLEAGMQLSGQSKEKGR